MKRVDFLVSILISSILLREYLNGNEHVFYVAIAGIIIYSLIGWMLDIQLNLLKRDCNVGGKEFSEKYKDIPSI